MKICPKCKELMGEQAAECCFCHTKLEVMEAGIPEYYDEDYEKERVDYSRRYHFYEFCTLDAFALILMAYFWLMHDVPYKPALFFLIIAMATLIVLPFALRLFRCPVCDSITSHRSKPWDKLFHCCCRCGTRIMNHLEFSIRVLIPLLVIAVASVIPLIVLLVYYSAIGGTGGMLLYFPTLTVSFLVLPVIPIVNLIAYLFLSLIWPDLFPDC